MQDFQLYAPGIFLAYAAFLLAIASPGTDLCQTVRKHDLGWCCKPGDPELIARKVSEAVGQQCIERQQRARDVACQEFDRGVVFKRFRDVLFELTGATASDRSPEPKMTSSIESERIADLAASTR